MREFVAVDVGPAPSSREGAAPAHLTLCFLGEVRPEVNGPIADRLREVAAASLPFVLRLEGLGAFPSAARPRVVWVGVTQGREEVVELARRVQQALADLLGTPAEEFVPHLTLFRVRSGADRLAADELLAGRRPAPPPREVRITELLLKESVLRSSGAVHRTVEAWPLGRREAGPPGDGRQIPRGDPPRPRD